jgi:hypothetical protein
MGITRTEIIYPAVKENAIRLGCVRLGLLCCSERVVLVKCRLPFLDRDPEASGGRRTNVTSSDAAILSEHGIDGTSTFSPAGNLPRTDVVAASLTERRVRCPVFVFVLVALEEPPAGNSQEVAAPLAHAVVEGLCGESPRGRKDVLGSIDLITGRIHKDRRVRRHDVESSDARNCIETRPVPRIPT